MGIRHSVVKSQVQRARTRLTEAELGDLGKTFEALAVKSALGEFVLASEFQAHYGLNGSLGARLFQVISDQTTEDNHLKWDDFVNAKAISEKGMPEEADQFAYKLIDLEGDGIIQRVHVGSVVSSCFQTALGLDTTVNDALLKAVVDVAKYSQESVGDGKSMSFPDMQEFFKYVPAVRRLLVNLMNPQGRPVPNLVIDDHEPDRQSDDGSQRQQGASANGSDLLLGREHAWLISGALPTEFCQSWSLVYSKRRHGTSFSNFMQEISTVQGPTILVVKDENGHTFGGFASTPSERHSGFFGDMKSFLFSLLPTAVIYRPTGQNRNIQWCASGFQSESIPNGIGFGGQVNHFGLFLSAGFESGHSHTSVTFQNPTLSQSPLFVPKEVEVWAVENGHHPHLSHTSSHFLSSPSSADEESILERHKEERHVLNLIGIADASYS